MQSGVMEGRDTARGMENKGKKRGRNSLNLYRASAARGQRPNPTHTCTHTHTYNKLKSQMRSFLSNTLHDLCTQQCYTPLKYTNFLKCHKVGF